MVKSWILDRHWLSGKLRVSQMPNKMQFDVGTVKLDSSTLNDYIFSRQRGHNSNCSLLRKYVAPSSYRSMVNYINPCRLNCRRRNSMIGFHPFLMDCKRLAGPETRNSPEVRWSIFPLLNISTRCSTTYSSDRENSSGFNTGAPQPWPFDRLQCSLYIHNDFCFLRY